MFWALPILAWQGTKACLPKSCKRSCVLFTAGGSNARMPLVEEHCFLWRLTAWCTCIASGHVLPPAMSVWPPRRLLCCLGNGTQMPVAEAAWLHARAHALAEKPHAWHPLHVHSSLHLTILQQQQGKSTKAQICSHGQVLALCAQAVWHAAVARQPHKPRKQHTCCLPTWMRESFSALRCPLQPPAAHKRRVRVRGFCQHTEV